MLPLRRLQFALAVPIILRPAIVWRIEEVLQLERLGGGAATNGADRRSPCDLQHAEILRHAHVESRLRVDGGVRGVLLAWAAARIGVEAVCTVK